jgi:stage V sporulation protein S
MDRFFSKLDLRDIKIDPRGNRFPPDEAAYESVELAAEDHDDQQANGFHVAQDTIVANAAVPVDPSSSHADHDDWDSPPGIASELDTAATSASGYGDRLQADDLSAMTVSDGEVLKVSARSRPSAVAGAIAGVVREAGRAEVQAIGAGATNQAIKAVAIARDYLRETGIEAVCLPAFIDITIDNEDRTAIRLVIEPR